MNNSPLKILIEKAIEREEEAYNFYIKLYNNATDKKAKNALRYIAEQEKLHKEFLTGYINGKYTMNSLKMHEIIDHEIAQYMYIPKQDENAQNMDTYLTAVHRELNLHNFYSALAGIQPYGIVKKTLVNMSKEELKHKKEIDNLYSKKAFPQTEGN